MSLFNLRPLWSVTLLIFDNLPLIHRLFIITDKAEITTHPQNVTTTEGGNVTLSCNAIGNPVPTLSWTKDGSPISSNSSVSLSADNKRLTITNVKRNDSGEYRCVTTNSVGNEISNAAKLDVQCKCFFNLANSK